MNKVQKLLVDFSKYTNSGLASKVDTIIDALTGNPEIPTPQPTVVQLQTALDDFRATMTAAEMGGKTQRELRDAQREVLVDLVKQEANYITMIANGNVATMLSTGFDVSKIPSPVGPLPKPQKFIALSVKKGILKLSVEAVNGAKNYQFEYKKQGDTEWIVVPSTRTRLVVQGMESATVYIARVLPVGASEERVYSDELPAVVI